MRPITESSSRARRKKFVAVAPGINDVTVMPLSFSSDCSPAVKDCRNAFEALYTVWYGPGSVAATDEVTSTLPARAEAIASSTILARWTVPRTSRSTTSSSSVTSVSRKVPPRPMPALSAAAAGGRPSAASALPTVSTPASVRRSATTACTVPGPADKPAATASRSGSSATATTS